MIDRHERLGECLGGFTGSDDVHQLTRSGHVDRIGGHHLPAIGLLVPVEGMIEYFRMVQEADRPLLIRGSLTPDEAKKAGKLLITTNGRTPTIDAHKLYADAILELAAHDDSLDWRSVSEGILRSARDGDIGAFMGFGFPPFRGGPFMYVDQVGAATIVDRLEGLADTHGERFAPAQILVDAAEHGTNFRGE